MKRKPIKIDWDDLESAFSNKNQDLVYYLDLVTGQIHLEGEREEDEDGMHDPGVPDPTSGTDSTRLYVETPGLDDQVAWMRGFIRDAEGIGPDAAGELEEALAADDTVGAVRAVLDRRDEVRDLWYAYRSDRLRDAIDSWLDANGVKPTDPPPWR